MYRFALLALTLPSAALAYESEPADLFFSDAYDVFTGVEYDTGNWGINEVGVRFLISSDGAAYTEMEGVSHLTWPDALTQRIEGIPGSGWFALHTDITLAATVYYDLFGYDDVLTIWSERLLMAEETTFDPFLLAGAPVRTVSVASQAAEYPPLRYRYAVGAGVEIGFNLNYFPQARATLTGKRMNTGDALITQQDAEILIPVPEENPGLLELATTFTADITAALDLVLQPGIEVCVPVYGCEEIADFNIPVELASVSGERTFAPVAYEHPLPSLENMVSGHDFGAVEVGNLSNFFVDFSNIGYLDLEAWVSVEGSENFTVYPEYVHATRGNIDGVVITYSPDSFDVTSAMLVVESNDPTRARIEIPLSGLGIADDACSAGEGDSEGTVSSCGCSAGAVPSGAAWAVLAGLGALVRRRRAAR